MGALSRVVQSSRRTGGRRRITLIIIQSCEGVLPWLAVCYGWSSNARTRLRFFRFPSALVRNCLTAINIRTRSPIFLTPISFKTVWSHSRRLSPLKLFTDDSRVSGDGSFLRLVNRGEVVLVLSRLFIVSRDNVNGKGVRSKGTVVFSFYGACVGDVKRSRTQKKIGN